jgi:hypothetical protein
VTQPKNDKSLLFSVDSNGAQTMQRRDHLRPCTKSDVPQIPVTDFENISYPHIPNHLTPFPLPRQNRLLHGPVAEYIQDDAPDDNDEPPLRNS